MIKLLPGLKEGPFLSDESFLFYLTNVMMLSFLHAGHRKITVTTMVSCLSIWALLKLFRRLHISSLRHDGSHCHHVLTRFPVIPPLIMDLYIAHLYFLHLSPP